MKCSFLIEWIHQQTVMDITNLTGRLHCQADKQFYVYTILLIYIDLLFHIDLLKVRRRKSGRKKTTED